MKTTLKILYLSILTNILCFAQTTTLQPVTLIENFDEQPRFWSYAGPYNADGHRIWYEKGKLQVQRTSDNTNWFYRAFQMAPDSDFELEMAYTIQSGKGTAGIALDIIDNTSHNFFKMSHDARTWVGTYEWGSKEWKNISRPNDDKQYDVECEAGKPVGQENILKVKRIGEDIEFYVNNELIHSFEIEEDFPGIMNQQLSFGIAVLGAFSTTVDWWKCTYIPKEVQYSTTTFNVKSKEFVFELNDTTGWHSDRFGRVAANGDAFYLIRNYEGTSDDIYYAEPTSDSTWKPAKNIGKPLNNKEANNVIAISQDNNMLYVWGKYTPEGEYHSPGMSVSTRQNNGWSVPVGVPIRDYTNKASNREETVSADKSVMILSLQDSTSRGNRDLYVSFVQTDGSYSKPKNMGEINGIGDESMPWLAADNKTLYFAAGLGTYGSTDIVVSKRLDDTWMNWSKPENLGPTINTPVFDAYFSVHPNGKYAYMNTGDGYREGIFRINLETSNLDPRLLPEPTVLVRGVVVDSKTKAPLQSKIQYFDLQTNELLGTAISDPITGKYSVVLPANRKYSFFGNVQDYFPVSENLEIPAIQKSQTIERNLLMVKLEKGAVVPLNNIFFDTNKDQLRVESYHELERLLTLLQQSASMTIQIAGHTDNVGNDASNMVLSTNRAKAVYEYLKAKGVAINRMQAKGYGKTKPIAPNTSDENKQKNRRVEFVITTM